MEKDKSLIPKGLYCYDENGVCPYWSCDKDRPEQENGHCSFLEKGDWDINDGAEAYDSTTGESVPIPFPVGLLWDRVKECDLNDYTDEELEEMMKDEKIIVQKTQKPISIKPDYIIKRKGE